VLCDDQGVWHIDLNSENGKRLKTEASNRKIPIHQRLIDEIFSGSSRAKDACSRISRTLEARPLRSAFLRGSQDIEERLVSPTIVRSFTASGTPSSQRHVSRFLRSGVSGSRDTLHLTPMPTEVTAQSAVRPALKAYLDRVSFDI
jgi:hypothetical protein